MMRTYENAFTKAARQTKNASGQGASVEFKVTNTYPPFSMSKRHPAVGAVVDALAVTRRRPNFRVIDGGLDANCLTAIHGIPAVTIGAGDHNPHTVNEYLDVPEYLDACRVLLQFAAGPKG